MHRVFISFHHANDQAYKEELVRQAELYDIFSDWSVDTGEIDPDLPNDTIRRLVRDDYLRSSTVTIALVGQETRYRMHCDWELKSSMINGQINRKSGILVIMLPSTGFTGCRAAHTSEKSALYPHVKSWGSYKTETEYRNYYGPYMPQRIIDNFVKGTAKISVTTWDRIDSNPDGLRLLIENAHAAREKNEYCLKLPMRRRNHTSSNKPRII